MCVRVWGGAGGGRARGPGQRDFSAPPPPPNTHITQLTTPRELLLFMTELLARVEAHPEADLSAQDMEIAVTKALEQAV